MAHGLAAVRDRLPKGRLDGILLDIGLDLDQGLAALEALVLLDPGVPVLVLLGQGTSDQQLAASVACLRRGADDAVGLEEGADAIMRLVVLAKERQTLARTKDGERQRLAHEKELLAEKIKALEGFAHRLAHEMKAPVRSSLLRLQQALEFLDSSDDPAARAALLGMGERLTLMSRVVDDVLAAEAAGSSQAPPTMVGVADLVAETVNLLDPGPAAQVTIDVDVAPLLARRAALQSVVQNLVGNALKHSGSTDPRVVFTARDLGTLVVFSVQDSGPGIPEADRDRVMQLFAARNPARADSTGIGLPLARRLVEANGGTIGLEPAPEGGTLVRFTWPRVPPPSMAPALGRPVVHGVLEY